MDISERHYFAVPNGQNTNYYRLRVEASARLGDAGYRSGWFPADAVDYAFGNVSEAGGTEALATRNRIKEQINQKVLETNQAWLNEAAKPGANIGDLERLQSARRRILAYPSLGPPFPGTFEIEYNPAKGVYTRFADDKLIFVLSSNPDQVIQNIAGFAESRETVLAIDRLAGVISQRARNEIAAAETIEETNKRIDAIIFEQIELALKVAEDSNTTSTTAIREINTLLIMLDSLFK
jgi:hypothetical protein